MCIRDSLDSILFDNQRFYLSWNSSNENDISNYRVEQISPVDSSVISNSIDIESNKANFEISTQIDEEHYYRLRVNDVWGNFSYSNINPASSYQKIVKLDTVTENGNNIIIMNLGPTMPFMHILTSVNASFPIWIQDGKKVFSFTTNNVGLSLIHI